jgi:hypothetical protein
VTTNAVYVKLDCWTDHMQYDYGFTLQEMKLEGNARMLKQDQAEGRGMTDAYSG